MSKLIISILIVVVIVVGFFLISKPGTVDGEAIITITDEGFSPSEVKIKLGSSVRFVNEGKFWHWPASDLHPSHTLYPEFDPKKPIGPGESWSFTFNKPGEWGFHDHLSALVTGKVVVVE